MRKIPSFIFCAITMVLFIGPALLSVGIPAASPASQPERQLEKSIPADDVLCRVPAFAFDVSKPLVPGWRLIDSESRFESHRVRLARDASATIPSVEVTIDARNSDNAGPLTAEDVRRIEDSLAAGAATRASFDDRACRFAGHDAVQVEASASHFPAVNGNAPVTARAIRHRHAVIVVEAHANNASDATAHAALDDIESCLQFH
ncbi:MAG: hypothetical protein HYR85_16130 [Planctomycetes bacterium]|nr:hypothetical protein [Planctomycetota bacterium]